MTNSMDLASVRSDRPVPFTDLLRLAGAAYLARFKGSSREYTESDLRDVPIAARHADTRTTMRYDRARNDLDRHPSQSREET
jgi:hypothetical protein